MQSSNTVLVTPSEPPGLQDRDPATVQRPGLLSAPHSCLPSNPFPNLCRHRPRGQEVPGAPADFPPLHLCMSASSGDSAFPWSQRVPPFP